MEKGKAMPGLDETDVKRIVRGVLDALRGGLGLRPYYSPPQVAERLGVESKKVLAWIRRSELTAVNIADRPYGRARWRISAEAIEQFLERRSNKPPAEAPRRQYSQRRQPVYRDDDIRWNYPPEHLVRLSAKAMPCEESWHENLECAIERFRAKHGESESIQAFLKRKSERTKNENKD